MPIKSFEGFVGAEIAKLQVNAGRRVQLYHFRDQQGLEVDFLVPLGAKRVALSAAGSWTNCENFDGKSVSRASHNNVRDVRLGAC